MEYVSKHEKVNVATVNGKTKFYSKKINKGRHILFFNDFQKYEKVSLISPFYIFLQRQYHASLWKRTFTFF